jgi:hypothetical protein
MKTKLEFDDLKQQLDDIHQRYPNFKPDDLFVCWFLRAYLTDDEQSAVTAVTGGSGDKSVDAVLIDHKAMAVFLVQGKYRQTLGKGAEKRGDVMDFANLAKPISDEDPTPFDTLKNGMNEHAAKLLSEARSYLIKKSYRLRMYYVTLGSVSDGLQKEAERVVSNSVYDAVFEVLDSKRLMHLLRDYLDGVAPPIPTLDLEMEQQPGVKVNGILQRFDGKSSIESWVFSMRGDSVADMFEATGLRLYARNIRGFLGEKGPINDGMTETLREEPDRFFYYNNGITIICDRAEKRSSGGRDYLRVSNPQVINGQQTSRMLALNKQDAEKASVLVKVMQVPRSADIEIDGFDSLVWRIVANTNWQNKIDYSDLISNDRVQIELERGFRKLGYHYIRKRQKKSEARAEVGKNYFIIRKEELAQAVAACELDPVTIREGKEELFSTHYGSIFPNSDPNFYLPRFWARKQIRLASHGIPERSYMAALAVHFLWSKLRQLLRSAPNARRFREMCELRDRALSDPLGRLCELIFQEVNAYYRANRKENSLAKDPSNFFRNKKGRHKEFANWKWSRAREKSFERSWQKVEIAIKEDWN